MIKLRELETELQRAGCDVRQARGSHRTWTHPQQPERRVVLSGNPGEDAERYQVKQVRRFLRGTMVYQ